MPFNPSRPHKCQADDCRERARVWLTKGKFNKNLCHECKDKYLEQKWKILDW